MDYEWFEYTLKAAAAGAGDAAQNLGLLYSLPDKSAEAILDRRLRAEVLENPLFAAPLGMRRKLYNFLRRSEPAIPAYIGHQRLRYSWSRQAVDTWRH